MRGPLVFAAALFALAGCGESTAPGNFDPAATGAKVAQALGAVQNNRAVQGFDVMSGAFTFAGAAPPFAGTASAAAPTAVLPANVLGKTFAYNSTTGKYQPRDTTGAPATGVRFLLYAVDTVSRTVVSPLQQIGYVDLTDKSSTAANTIGITALVGNNTVLAYDANASIGAGGSFSYGAKGNTVDGSNRLDFDISQNAASSGAVQVDYKLTASTASPLGIEITANAATSTSGNSALAVTDNTDKIEIAVNTSGGTSSGTARFNGQTVANVTAAGNGDPTFTASGGRTLSASDLGGLKQLYKIVDLTLNRFDDLLFPSYFVFGLVR